MSRSYRMRYHTDDPIPLIGEPAHRPTQINVNTMIGGDPYILFTENDDETVLDVKNALRPHIVRDNPKFNMVFSMLSPFRVIDDNALVSSLADDDNVVEFELLFRDVIVISLAQCITDAAMEATLSAIRNNSIAIVKIYRNVPINHVLRFVHAIRENNTIDELILSNCPLTANSVRRLFDMIGGYTNLRSLTITEDESFFPVGKTTIRMDDLVQLLNINTSLNHIHIENAEVIFGNAGDVGDVREFVDALGRQRNLETLTLVRNNGFVGDFFVEGQLPDEMDGLDELHTLNVLLGEHGDDIVTDGEINLRWRNPNL